MPLLSVLARRSPEMEDIQTLRILVFGMIARKVDTVCYRPFLGKLSLLSL
jgi:hypothetical protein